MAGFVLMLCAFVLGGCFFPSFPEYLEEASGVVRYGNSLLIVDDSQPGVYFRFPLDDNYGPVIPINPARTGQISFPWAKFLIDLEAIEVLADDRIVVLSERLRSLLSRNGLVVQYEDQFAEVGERGLEGVAVKRLANRSSRVAVVWEGGYLQDSRLNPQLRSAIGGKALRPIILVHDLQPDQSDLLVRAAEARNLIELDVPVPAGAEPEVQRFRAPDLVWSNWTGDSGEDEGFIVLLNSQNGIDPPQFQYHWLQRFSLNGNPIGKPLDVDSIAPPELKGINWEGLAWFEEPKTLVLIHERGDAPVTSALVVSVPDDWKTTSVGE